MMMMMWKRQHSHSRTHVLSHAHVEKPQSLEYVTRSKTENVSTSYPQKLETTSIKKPYRVLNGGESRGELWVVFFFVQKLRHSFRCIPVNDFFI
ncbi:hypothetical protein [Psittacid alphaherpesvirus 5]|uniref:Uncharacterized protein n=1 Tax=Psittacid alphaherpesvirus 5 TaxID=2972693 RepID=A0A5P9JR65_9ALPH|nr:hypothetical protein QKU09_gp65 [Psittacid alphaherpesvirus 5]QFU14609.1 hypothetical protein [Psittacid alphaherpesvirus 5]